MDYAMIENGRVVNLISLRPANAAEFPNAVAIENRPVLIGDAYENGVFLRDGEPVLSELEQLRAYYNAMQEALNHE